MQMSNNKRDKLLLDALGQTRQRALKGSGFALTFMFNKDGNWGGVYNANKSTLCGLMFGCRQNTREPRLFWVGLFGMTNDKMDTVNKKYVEVSFDQEPTTLVVIDALTAKLRARKDLTQE